MCKIVWCNNGMRALNYNLWLSIILTLQSLCAKKTTATLINFDKLKNYKKKEHNDALWKLFSFLHSFTRMEATSYNEKERKVRVCSCMYNKILHKYQLNIYSIYIGVHMWRDRFVKFCTAVICNCVVFNQCLCNEDQIADKWYISY